MSRKVQVLVVDDSKLCRALISDALMKDPAIEVVGEAENGEEAIAKNASLRPHVITMDVDMPVLDGLTATERIMADAPTPILMLTGDPTSEVAALTHRALDVGALALQVKPALDAGSDAWNLTREVKLLASVKVIRHVRGTKRAPTMNFAPISTTPSPVPMFGHSSPVGLVAVASSTGGPQVVQKFLAELPHDFPAPVLVVQHINAAFADSLVGWLQTASKLKVKVARDGDLLTPGVVLVAGAAAHVVVPQRGRIELKVGDPVDGHVPSATLMLASAARAYGKRCLGVILTGMGSDGVDGMVAIRAAGGKTLAQSQESCVVYGMPGAAVSKGVIDHVIHGDDLAAAVVAIARGDDLTPGPTGP